MSRTDRIILLAAVGLVLYGALGAGFFIATVLGRAL